MPFEVIQGTKDEPGYSCTFCASKFPSRAELSAHWEADPRCKRNRFVSNSTQSKYNDAPEEEPAPEGELE